MDSGKRIFKIKGMPVSHGAYDHPVRWTMAAYDVIARGAERLYAPPMFHVKHLHNMCDLDRRFGRSIEPDLRIDMRKDTGTKLFIVILALLAGCAPGPTGPAGTDRTPATAFVVVSSPTPVALSAAAAASTAPPSISPTRAASPTLAFPIASQYDLSLDRLALLGAPTSAYVPTRSVVLERFENGVMVIFAKTDKGFDASGSEYIFALAKDGHAYRIADTFVETSKNSDTWYTCDAKTGQRPEKSGVPWRGFGKAWCDHPQVRSALGGTRGYEEADITASFQSFERGRAFQVSEWRGMPGWKSDHVYTVYLDNTAIDLASGRWE